MNERKTLKVNDKHLEIGKVDVSFLVKKYGTPLYVFDKAHLKSISNAYLSCMLNDYGYGSISYASKAFCCKEILRVVKQEGLGVDVVSVGELYTALCVDFPPEKIIFHGNNKSKKDLKYAIDNNVGLIVVDSLTELDDINDICLEINKKQDILIRVNPGVEAHTHHYIQTAKPDSKFGFSIDLNAFEVVKKAILLEGITLKGLHCHIGSQIFEEKSYELAVDKMLDFYSKVKIELKFNLDILDLGGGFGIYYSNDDKVMNEDSYKSFLKVIFSSINKKISKLQIKKPYLILEPGRSIVGEAGITLYTVGRIKEIKNIKTYLSVDGGMFENPRYALYQAKYSVVAANRMDEALTNRYTIAGKCCESGDILAEDVYLPEMEEGDLLAVLSTGAYNYSMASNYNRNFVPPVVMVEDGKDYLAVKPQTFDDLIRNDI